MRISPFNSNAKRHTSFAMVEVLPVLPKLEFEKFKANLNSDDIEVETSKSSGPGGQNVNKKGDSSAGSHTNLQILRCLYLLKGVQKNRIKKKHLVCCMQNFLNLREEKIKLRKKGMQISKTTEIEWGNQIQNYVLHPYKLVKDLRTGIESSDVESILEKGEIEEFIEAEKNI